MKMDERDKLYYESEIRKLSNVILEQRSKISELQSGNDDGYRKMVAKLLAAEEDSQKLGEEISYLKSLIRVSKKV